MSERTATSGFVDEVTLVRAPLVPVVIYFLSNCKSVLYTSERKRSWDFLKTCIILSPLLLSPSYHTPPPHPCPLRSRISPLPAWPALP